VSDIGMPDEDGLSLIKQLRGMLGGERLPSIALTAYSRPADRDRAIAAGFDMHLAKPIDVTALVEAAARLTRG
jgi:CheY-like chemotaxis protein